MATLTFVYAESTAVIGPLATSREPHSWDLCEDHARRITVPRGWEMLRSENGFSAPMAEDHELTALAEAVREVGGPRVARRPTADVFDGLDEVAVNRRVRSAPAPEAVHESPATPHHPRPRPGRRGHLRVLPDPVD